MPQRYRAYLLRHWHLANGRERVEVQHIQTGDRTRHPTLSDAWLLREGQGGGDAPDTLSATPAMPPVGSDLACPLPERPPERRAERYDGATASEEEC
jgi:hypothetical protein